MKLKGATSHNNLIIKTVTKHTSKKNSFNKTIYNESNFLSGCFQYFVDIFV